jgi:hypothetical protein
MLKVTGAAAVAAGAASLLPGRLGLAKPTAQSQAETVVGRLYTTLSDEQRKAICFPFDHELRAKLSANWHITEPLIGSDFYTAEQRELIQQIVRGVSSPDGYERFVRQMEEDSGGMSEYSVALFGEPGSGKFQWELTGRHLTLRADGDSVENMAFGGPVVYGHGEESPAKNLFHYQTKQVNEVFGALEGAQRERALLSTAPGESDVPLQGKGGKFPGLAVGELSADQKQLFESTMKTILSPYRKEDVDEVVAILKESGGIDQLHLAFYQEGDLESDKVWDIWRVEGPGLVWHFRGAPHVHAYVNIGIKS